MSTVIFAVVYLAGIVAFYILLRERDIDALNAKNRSLVGPVRYAYARRNRLENSITALTSWVGIAILIISVMVGVFVNYDWKKPVKW